MKRIIIVLVAMLSMMSVCAKKTVVWEKPLSEYNRITQSLSISKVEFCDTATVLTFHLNFPGGQQIGFSNETMLQADGKDYKIKGIRDYAINAGITVPQSGEMDLDMIFNPLPKDVKSITFNMPGAFTINDIRDRNAKKEDLADTYWRNDKTGDWLIGFSKDMVIYDSRVWNITARNKDKHGEAIIAKDGADQLLVDVLWEKKGQRRILINNTLADCSRITSSYLPDYLTKTQKVNLPIMATAPATASPSSVGTRTCLRKCATSAMSLRLHTKASLPTARRCTPPLSTRSDSSCSVCL